ncbi:glycosyltransferase family 4 protein [Thermosynechococcaceae cyanobacterium BACA0444]|uniref:Glycosyltransferase family 4 protein n=1 Tax=Pseudocalidococcus azoricus BACA0444 TaxID=2918990 RepID=A0AAE4JVN2_9CYAN|nr:glycosyltransferase family 4 protein [Pseudocalidococcus azoricus]MDS3859243.1 glycosyltransferase family 4 protein [Pseudocalidococcus azoricus BACA0444]
MFIISHPTGNTFSRSLLKELEDEDLDFLFFTTLSVDEKSRLLSFLPSFVRAEILRRNFSITPHHIRTRPFREIIRLIAPKLGAHFLIKHETGFACIDAVYQDLDQNISEYLSQDTKVGSIQAVYCYEDGALQTFKTARQKGITCFYDLPIAYWETSLKLLQEEAARYPQWESTLIGTRNSSAKLERKTQELQLANYVICPSKFVRDSLPQNIVDSKKILVSEFGSPQLNLSQHDFQYLNKGVPLRVLFVGSMTQRKGLADIFAAFRLLKRYDIELLVLGSPVVSMKFYKEEFPNFQYFSPRPHSEVLKLMRTCDVFLFPSIVEGRALVQQEAMISGLPLITTYNAGADDLVEDGVTGFLVPIRSPESIAEKLTWFADNRDKIPKMSYAAFNKAKALTWEKYSKKIVSLVLSAM